MSKPRRQFLRSAVTIGAGLTMPCDPDAEAEAAQSGADVSGATATLSTEASLPTVRLGKHKVSRLIIGGNPLYGYSHFNRLFSAHMVEWATPERVCQILRQCEKNGINTWQFSHTERTISDLKRHRAEGGRMQWILLSHREIEEDHRRIGEVAKLGPVGIVHHGGSAERKRREGKLDKVRDFLKSVRDSGVMVGLSTHDPEFLQQVQEQNWDIDFFMTALYYLTRTPEALRKVLGTRPLGEVYLPDDPPRMCRVIRKTPKPCLCYKVLAAGRLTDTPKQIDEAFQFVYDNIKPKDAIIIGMYPRYSDQIKENADRVRRICGKRSA
jgi:hypothetical protein